MALVPEPATAQLGNCSQRVCPFPPSGVVFVKERDITISGDMWSVASSIDFAHYESLLLSLAGLVVDSSAHICHFNRSVPTSEIDRIHGSMDSLRDRLYQLSMLTSQGGDDRFRRGIFDAVGTGLKYLFGTMDADDFGTINDHIGRLAVAEDEHIHLSKEQLSYVKTLSDKIRVTHDDVGKLATVLEQNLKPVISALNSTNESIERIEINQRAQNQIFSLIRSIEFTIQSIDLELREVQHALDTLAQGRINSVVIPPTRLLTLLREVSLHLPGNLGLLIKPDQSMVHLYYSVCKAYAISYADGVRVVIEIPLKSINREFELYKLVGLPLWSDELGRYVELEGLASHLAVSPDRQQFALPDPEHLKSCTNGKYSVCGTDFPVYTSAGGLCEVQLFLRQTDAVPSTCRRRVHLGEIKTTFTRVAAKSGWVFSTGEIQVTLDCPNEIKPTTVKLRGAGILPRTATCHIFTPEFVLYPVTKGYLKLNIAAEVHIPPIKSILHSPEIENLQKYKEQVKLTGMETVEEIIKKHHNTSDTDILRLTYLMDKLEQEHLQHLERFHKASRTTVAGGGALALITTAAVLYCVRGHLWSWCTATCRRRNRNNAVPEPTQEAAAPLAHSDDAAGSNWCT